ncbi:MAG TPA: DUF167 domain-containing protein [Pseudonocardiaceae bacterium]|nr:DUF167 domain-containing protein [Pseudonocardiaceae bacterium]
MTEHRFPIRVRPAARRPTVGGQWDGRLGPALIVAVTAPAVDGKANEAVRRALADALDIPHRDIAIVTGMRSRDKLVAVADPPADLTSRLRRLADEQRQ